MAVVKYVDEIKHQRFDSWIKGQELPGDTEDYCRKILDHLAGMHPESDDDDISVQTSSGGDSGEEESEIGEDEQPDEDEESDEEEDDE